MPIAQHEQPQPRALIPPEEDRERSYQRGLQLYQESRFQDAAREFGEALSKRESSEGWNDWAAAEMACGHNDKAEEGFRRALALNAGDNQATANLGALLAGLGRAQEAIPFLVKAAACTDELQRATVTSLLAQCRTKAAADALAQSQAALRDLASAWQQSSLANGILKRVANLAPRPSVLLERPSSLGQYVLAQGPKAFTLESSSVCNLRCVMCPQARELVDRPRHFPEGLVEKLRPSLTGVELVQLHGIGEPLHSPAFWRFLETLNTPEGAHIEVNSNMTVLTDDQIGKILGSRLSLINVSLDAATAETYAKIRGYDFNKVLNNLKRLIFRRNAEGHAKPEIFLNMTLMRENIEELEAFVELGHGLGVQGLQFWHLNAGDDYQLTRKDGWTFDYKAQMLSNYPKLSNQKIRAAMALSERLGTTFKLNPSKNMFFEEGQCG